MKPIKFCSMIIESMSGEEILYEMHSAWENCILPAAERICSRKKCIGKNLTPLGNFSLPVKGTKYLYSVQAKKGRRGEILIGLDYLITIAQHHNNGGIYVIKTGGKMKPEIARSDGASAYVGKYEGHFFRRVQERLDLRINSIEEIARFYFKTESGTAHQTFLLRDREDGKIDFMEIGKLGIAFGEIDEFNINGLTVSHYKTFVRADMLHDDQILIDEEEIEDSRELAHKVNEIMNDLKKDWVIPSSIVNMFRDVRKKEGAQ